MRTSLSHSLALALAALSVTLPVSGTQASDRSLPMQFELRMQGPAQSCGKTCRPLISAAGAITATTPDDFRAFAREHDLTGALMVLDSDGGSVHGAIAFGREIRALALDTTVGRAVDLDDKGPGDRRARLSGDAYCESMCAFVLIAGIHRSVPPQASVMVHQIWLGDRRDDPTAGTYSAEDLVLVQRDIGRLARYTGDMGGSMDLLDLALRIPPWEPMHALTREELVRMRVASETPNATTAAAVAATPAAAARPAAAHGPAAPHAVAISERRWAVIDRAGTAAVARRHPLTVEGEEIGSFDLLVSCGASGDSYDVSYIERRHDGGHLALPGALDSVSLQAAGRETALKVVSSERRSDPDELITFAAGPVPAALIDGFAAFGNHSLSVETQSGRLMTDIRLGNTGARQALPQLATSCVKPIGERAELSTPKTGGLAAAK
ncbi:MAG TPA: hypothetical protein VG986_20070 [Pseudolabrys sp.]|nr:hypothetical protein [Pseudolabrys sp.]